MSEGKVLLDEQIETARRAMLHIGTYVPESQWRAIFETLKSHAALAAEAAALRAALANSFCDLREEVLRLTSQLAQAQADAERYRYSALSNQRGEKA